VTVRAQPTAPCGLTLLDAMADPALFARWFTREDSWEAWRAFLAACFGLPAQMGDSTDVAGSGMSPKGGIGSPPERPMRALARWSGEALQSGRGGRWAKGGVGGGGSGSRKVARMMLRLPPFACSVGLWRFQGGLQVPGAAQLR
jgi:hypothetical protein